MFCETLWGQVGATSSGSAEHGPLLVLSYAYKSQQTIIMLNSLLATNITRYKKTMFTSEVRHNLLTVTSESRLVAVPTPARHLNSDHLPINPPSPSSYPRSTFLESNSKNVFWRHLICNHPRFIHSIHPDSRKLFAMPRSTKFEFSIAELDHGQLDELGPHILTSIEQPSQIKGVIGAVGKYPSIGAITVSKYNPTEKDRFAQCR